MSYRLFYSMFKGLKRESLLIIRDPFTNAWLAVAQIIESRMYV